MDTNADPHRAARHGTAVWLRYSLIAVLFEKIIQHCIVTLAFSFNWAGIRSTVAVPPSVLLVLGAIVAGLFGLSLWGIVTQRRWAINLVIALAIFDIIGEFVAQGTLSIVVTVSFLVAIVLLVLALLYRRHEPGMITMAHKQLRPPDASIIKALYTVGLGRLIGRMILLLTTTGRKSGLPRVTPLQYEEIDGAWYVASAHGTTADWFRNILANRHVQVRVKACHVHGLAEPITNPRQIADFLELRLQRHPTMIRAILRSEGLPAHPSRADLEAYARKLAMVIIRPG
jgi:deazaflavin-dependent oxidoreductase (nitroreductase family)